MAQAADVEKSADRSVQSGYAGMQQKVQLHACFCVDLVSLNDGFRSC